MTLALVIYSAVVSTVVFAVQVRWFVQHVRLERATRKIMRAMDEGIYDRLEADFERRRGR